MSTETLQPAAEEKSSDARRWMSAFNDLPYLGVLIALAVVSILLAITQPGFGTWDNIMNIVRDNSVVLILALGATFVIISAGIDLSVSSMTAVSAMVFGWTLTQGMPLFICVLAAMGFGALMGCLMGITIAWLRISFLVVTLGGLSIFQSLALVMNDGATLSVFDVPSFAGVSTLVNGRIAGIPYLLLFDIAMVALAAYVLRYTSFGRAIFAVGSNVDAARLNGIKVGAVVVAIYSVAGLANGLGSVFQVGRLTGAAPQADPTLLLVVVTAVLIGGTAYSGGEGGVVGTVVGVLFLGVVQNGLTLVGVNTFWQGLVSGLILIAAVGVEVLRRRRAQP